MLYFVYIGNWNEDFRIVDKGEIIVVYYDLLCKSHSSRNCINTKKSNPLTVLARGAPPHKVRVLIMILIG